MFYEGKVSKGIKTHLEWKGPHLAKFVKYDLASFFLSVLKQLYAGN